MPNTVVEFYNEFIEDNLYKRYPLTEDFSDPGTFLIPDSFLADVSLCVFNMDRAGSSSYKYSIHISRISVYPDYIYVTLSDKVTGAALGKSDPIPVGLSLVNSVEDRTIPIRPVSDIPINGEFIIGTCEDIIKYQGNHTISAEYGLLFPSTVMISQPCVTGIRVGDTVATGDVVIEAGDNVDISYDDNSNTITISATAPANKIYTDEDLVAYIKEKYGNCITTINGILPDENGDFKIDPTDCVMVETDAANHSISFYNPCAPSCASYDFLDETLTRIKDLNNSVSLLRSFYESVSNTLAQMGVRVSAVIESRKENAAGTENTNNK